MRHLSQVVPDAPVLGDLAVGQPEPVDVLDGETLVRWGNAGRGGDGEWHGVSDLHREPVVAPERGRGRIVVMDNFSVHKSECGERPIEEGSKILLFLPPYPPDINPMEEVSSKAKSVSRKVSARTTEALLEATCSALDAITPEDIRGSYTERGYRLSLQLLLRSL